MALEVLVLAVLCADAPWEQQFSEEGVVLETQASAASSAERLRVTANTSASPEAFIRAWWGKAADTSASPEVARREVLSDGENERLYWDLIRASPASDRDYVMSLKRSGNSVEFRSVDDARKPAGRYVRMAIEGKVEAQPTATGTRITYVVVADIGGLVPSVLIRGSQRRASFNLVREIRRRAEREK